MRYAARLSGRRIESMLPDRVSNPGPLTYESGALPIALRGPATQEGVRNSRGKRAISIRARMIEGLLCVYILRLSGPI